MAGVPSPCRQVCRLSASGICIGCGRTALEIRNWLALDENGRRAVLAQAATRLPVLAADGSR
ncbi:MAG: DUF1289 domain-containing protein [Pseudomonadota bacterium]|nr:DUF1289 domain-containing protein [Pseudomonadota bacterium]HJO34587.1 DUF1289 domain-containing protein [Gammaproteobacteria bacterium]